MLLLLSLLCLFVCQPFCMCYRVITSLGKSFELSYTLKTSTGRTKCIWDIRAIFLINI